MAVTYILECKNGDYYVGSTNNLTRRLKEHKNGESRATKGKLPVKLVYKKEFETLKQARIFEYFLKRQRNKNFTISFLEEKLFGPSSRNKSSDLNTTDGCHV